MNCKLCNNTFTLDELDTDQLCYGCANIDKEFKHDIKKITQELVENTIKHIANITTKDLKDKLSLENYVEKALKQGKKPAKNENSN